MTALFATPYRRGALALALVTLCWRAWTVGRWSWVDDDWVYLADAAAMPLHDYVFQMYNGHLMPAQFFLTWVVTEVAPLNFALPAALTALTAGAAVLLWSRALAALAGERFLLLLPLALVSLSPVFIRPTLWWASALQAVPLQVCLAWGVLVAARMATKPTRRDAVHLTAALLAALLFWEKSLLLAVPFTLILLCAHGGNPVQRARLHGRSLAAMAAVCGGYLALYAAVGRLSSNQTGTDLNFNRTPTLSESADFYWTGLGNVFAPALLGGPWGSLPAPGDFYATANSWVTLGTTVVLVLGVVATIVLRRGAWLPLTVAAIYLVGAWGMVLVSSRFANIGSVLVKDERYVVDGFAIAVVCGVLAWTRPLRRAGSRRAPRPLPRAVSLVAATGLAVSLVVANVWADQRNGTSPAASWVNNVRHQVADASRSRPSDQPLVLVDGTAPERVIQAAFWGENTRLSRMLGALRPDIEFRRPSDEIWLLTDAGLLQPGSIDPVVTSQPGPSEVCGHAVEPGRDTAVPMSGELFHWGWGLEISTFSDKPAELTLDLGDEEVTMSLPSGPQSRIVQYDGQVPQSIVARSASTTSTICITELQVGSIVPRA